MNRREQRTRTARAWACRTRIQMFGYQVATVTGMETLRPECFTPKQRTMNRQCTAGIFQSIFLIDFLAEEMRGVRVPPAAVRLGWDWARCRAPRRCDKPPHPTPGSDWQALSGLYSNGPAPASYRDRQ